MTALEPGAVGDAIANTNGTTRAPLQRVLDTYAQPAHELIGKLPRKTCAACRDRKSGACDQHAFEWCETCRQKITSAHIHLDYLGHAEVTRILIDVDPHWAWEPVAWDGAAPAFIQRGKEIELWARLTVLGKTLLCVGTVEAGAVDTGKQLIGDMLRNGAMRFGIGVNLWSKSERAEAEVEPSAPKPARRQSKAADRRVENTTFRRPAGPPAGTARSTDDLSPAELAAQRLGIPPSKLLVEARKLAPTLDPPHPAPTKITEVDQELLAALIAQHAAAADEPPEEPF